MESNSNEDKLEGWSKEDKFMLLEALKEVGSYNVANIKEFLSNKTEDEIAAALEFYKKKSSLRPPPVQKRERKMNIPMVPLSLWAKFIVDTHGYEDLQTETAAALRLIAEFEHRPPAICTEKINFQKVYYMLADALEGKPLADDKYIMTLFDKCIVETALTCKAMNGRQTSFKTFFQLWNPTDTNANAFIKPTEDNELSTLRQIITKTNYNPLNIPETHLKYSSCT